jgi:hypothetical protein
MKTNIVMKSENDRNLFGVVIRQETKTGFFNLSDLQECYLRARIKNGWVDKRIDHILSRIENTERIYYVLKEQNIINVRFDTFIEDVNNEGISKVLKKYGVYKTTGARHTKTTWVHDSVWVLVALELSPIFYAKTVIWLRDDLIKNRIEAGNFCKALNSSIQKFKPDGNNYITLAKALNHIVFNKHEAGIRNTGTKEQLKELANIEEKMAFAIDMGYIISFDMLLQELRKLWKQHNKAINMHEASLSGA